MDAAQREILAANLRRVRERIAAACARVKRDPKEVTLIAVTKTVGPEVMQALIELGVTDIGENKLQAAQEKFPHVPAFEDRKPGEGRAPRDEKPWPVRTHFIGHLQTNKVRGVLQLFDVIHTIDSIKLVQEIERRAIELGQPIVPCFIEVNSGEAQKSGVSKSELHAVYEAVRLCKHIDLLGLMTMAPMGATAEELRLCFGELRLTALDDYLIDPWAEQGYRSMGMSNDFEIAIEEGATHVRIGTALFEGL